MSQQDRVRRMLEQGWVCGTTFLDERMPRYGARIYELRQRGCIVDDRPCANPHHHHRTRQWEWRLVAQPDRTGQVALAALT